MEKIIFLGDIHGEFDRLKREILEKNIGGLECITYIIQVGDFGIGFNDKTDKKTLIDLNFFLQQLNIEMLVISGNHDSPIYFNGSHKYTNLKLLENYTVLNILNKKYLFVGGGISIDRKQRHLNHFLYNHPISYWEDEVFKLDLEKLKFLFDIDVVVTHIAPNFCYPDNTNGFGDIVYSFAKYDDFLLNDLEDERNKITNMFNILYENGNNIKEHYYGHYHHSNITNTDKTQHRLLNIFEFLHL